ncbi:hypothetical protein EON82_01775 [bacterium]|nr:MAG: hypothetical protein EON82_01775 [bacterium]
MLPVMQVAEPSFWSAPNGSTELWTKIVVSLVLGILLIFALMAAPVPARRPIVVGVTFLAGLYYVLSWLWPNPIAREDGDIPRNAAEGFSFWLADAQDVVTQFSNIISAFLIGLGLFSLLRIHIRRLLRAQKDWGYSLVLLVSMVTMVVFGYWDWIQRQSPEGANMASGVGWGFPQYAYDLLFDGLLQQMEAAMFSVVAFYILSAAYRAFRARSAEATILLVTALVVMVSLMGIVTFLWDKSAIVSSLGDNAKLTTIAGWITAYLQTPAIRGIDFGVGVGLMAMGLRIWLSLEKTGGNV